MLTLFIVALFKLFLIVCCPLVYTGHMPPHTFIFAFVVMGTFGMFLAYK